MDANQTGPIPKQQQQSGGAELWTRDGFNGAVCAMVRANYSPNYLSAVGPHAPRGLNVDAMVLPDQEDSDALPLVVATSKLGIRVSVSGRSKPMPFIIRNVEADEMHFIHEGIVEFQTDCGVLTAGPGDFVSIPKSIAYRIIPLGTSMRSVIIESPTAFKLDTPIGLINVARDVQFASLKEASGAGDVTTLLLKAEDGITRFVIPHCPLAAVAHVFGPVPVWKVNLANIQVGTYLPNGGGPPSQFITSLGNDVMLFNLSARVNTRSPIHVNADYDEVIFYFRGPGAWGGVKAPGTMTLMPKGVIHHGPDENVPEGYMAWLMESRATFRLTPEGAAVAQLIDSSRYSRHESVESV